MSAQIYSTAYTTDIDINLNRLLVSYIVSEPTINVTIFMIGEIKIYIYLLHVDLHSSTPVYAYFSLDFYVSLLVI